MKANDPGTWPYYFNKDNFYWHRGGRGSGECDFGVHNRLPQRLIEKYPVFNTLDWAVSVVADTGDVYAWHHYESLVFLLGRVNGGSPQAGDWSTRLSAPRTNKGRLDLPSDLPAAYLDAEERFKDWAYGRTAGRNLLWFAERCIPVTAEDGPPHQ